jgi:hypothetical protein
MMCSLSVNQWRLQAIDLACGGRFRLAADGRYRGRAASLARLGVVALGGVSVWCLPTISSGVGPTIGDVLPDRIMIGGTRIAPRQ